jgi:hypothetical protein
MWRSFKSLASTPKGKKKKKKSEEEIQREVEELFVYFDLFLYLSYL